MLLSRNCFTYAQSKERNEMSASDCCLLEEVQRGERKREREREAHRIRKHFYYYLFVASLFSLTQSLTGHTSGVVCSSGIGWVRSAMQAMLQLSPFPVLSFAFCHRNRSCHQLIIIIISNE